MLETPGLEMIDWNVDVSEGHIPDLDAHTG